MKLLKGSANYLNCIEKRDKGALNYLMLNLPFHCNYKCQKCCNEDRISQSTPLNLETIKKYVEKCKQHDFRVLVIAGEGEPFLDKNIKELISFTHGAGFIPYIFTNGSMINQDLALFLAKNDVSLIINIDSFIAEEYDKYICRKRAFERIMSNLKVLRDIYQQKVYSEAGYLVSFLAINLVLNNENKDQISKLIQFCGDDIIPVVNRPIKIGSAAQSWKKYKDAESIEIDETNLFPLGTITGDDQCSYLRNGISLGADGNILTCAYALDTNDLYGNLNDDILLTHKKVLESVNDFYKENGAARCILRHPKYNKFISYLKTKKLFS